MRQRPFLSGLVLFLMSCVGLPADSQTFPSLARRPVESRDYDALQRAAAEKSADQPAEPALQTRIEGYEAEARAGATSFDTAYAAAGRDVAAAAGAGVDADAYAVAQSAISALEASRNRTVIALANLDSLYAERLNAVADGKAAGGAQTIAAARGRALALVDSQNDRIDGLKARLPQP